MNRRCVGRLERRDDGDQRRIARRDADGVLALAELPHDERRHRLAVDTLLLGPLERDDGEVGLGTVDEVVAAADIHRSRVDRVVPDRVDGTPPGVIRRRAPGRPQDLQGSGGALQGTVVVFAPVELFGIEITEGLDLERPRQRFECLERRSGVGAQHAHMNPVAADEGRDQSVELRHVGPGRPGLGRVGAIDAEVDAAVPEPQLDVGVVAGEVDGALDERIEARAVDVVDEFAAHDAR